jgi:hypothetical protein
MGKQEEMRKIAYEILKNANGKAMKYGELIEKVSEKSSYSSIEVNHACWKLPSFYKDVIKPDRGMIQILQENYESKLKGKEIGRDKEKALYEPFTDWLMYDINECTDAIPLGGNKFRDKWGTPDVLGVRRSNPIDLIQMPLEIISAEIKLNPAELITGFGQACAYRLFSHKVYLVVPSSSITNGSSEEDLARLDILCQLFGISLVLFSKQKENEEEYNFEIRARPRKYEPDMFYVNHYLEFIKEDLFRKHNR